MAHSRLPIRPPKWGKLVLPLFCAVSILSACANELDTDRNIEGDTVSDSSTGEHADATLKEDTTTDSGPITDTRSPNDTRGDAEYPQTDAEYPQTDAEYPQTDSEYPQTDTEQPQTDTEQPQTDTEQPQTDTEQPQTDTEQPQTDTEQPQTDTEQPQICDDPDGDGYGDGLCAGHDDCAPQDPDIHPGQTEICNGIDDNCNGVVDEGDCSSNQDCAHGDGICPDGCYAPTDDDCALDCRDPATWPPEWVAFEDEVIRLLNLERAQGAACGGGFEPNPPSDSVTLNIQIREAARCHSLDMAIRDYVAHENPEGESASERLLDAGYDWSTRGENVGAGQDTPAAMVQRAMGSPGHCDIFTDPRYDEVGIGYVYQDPDALNYESYWTAVLARD